MREGAANACRLLSEFKMSSEGMQLLPEAVFWLVQKALCQALMAHPEYSFELTDEQSQNAWSEAGMLIEMGWPE